MSSAVLQATGRKPAPQPALPRISPLFLRLFHRIARRQLARQFHAVRILRSSLPAAPLESRVVFANHPSWWDPLVLLLVAEQFFPGQHCFAPIDPASLKRYSVLRRLGFFAVAPRTQAGALTFLRTATALLRHRETMIWLTPQGQFADCRTRPVTLQRGVGFLASRISKTTFLPIALEYVFWTERLPEALVCFGKPIANLGESGALTVQFERGLEQTQDELAKAASRWDPAEWEFLLRGRVGVGTIYDSCRRWGAFLRGERFSAAHHEE